jgi:hypothetical protein
LSVFRKGYGCQTTLLKIIVVALQDIYFIFAHDLARIFTSKKNLPDPSQNQMAGFQARFCEK